MTQITRESLKAAEKPYQDAAEYYLNLPGRRRPAVYDLADQRGLRRERLQAMIDRLFHFRHVC